MHINFEFASWANAKTTAHFCWNRYATFFIDHPSYAHIFPMQEEPMPTQKVLRIPS